MWHKNQILQRSKSASLSCFECVCVHRPGGSDDGGVEASVAGDGHGQRDDPPCPAEHLVCKRLWGWGRNKMLTGKLLTRLTSKLIIRCGPVWQHHGAFPSALLAPAKSCCSDVPVSARVHQQTTSGTELRQGLVKMVGLTRNQLWKCYCSNRILYEKSVFTIKTEKRGSTSPPQN